MGNGGSKPDGEREGTVVGVGRRDVGITGGAAGNKRSLPKLPPNSQKAHPDDYATIEVCSNRCMVNLAFQLTDVVSVCRMLCIDYYYLHV